MKTDSRSLNAKIWLATAVSFVVLLLAGTASAQWSGSPNIYYNGGNVGVGTTSPSSPLSVVNAGTTSATFGRDTTQAAQVTINYSNATDQAFAFRNTNTNGRVWSIGDGIGTGAGNFGVYDQVAGANRFTIGTNGFIGLNGATSPEEFLHIAGNATIKIGGSYAAGIRQAFVSGVGAQLDLGEYYGSTTFIPRMTIVGGNVGIGTTSPFTSLQVNGISTISAGNVDANNVAGWRMQTWSGDSFIDNHGGHTYFRAGAGSSENAAARTVMTFDNSNGNVGIGKTNPTVALDVVGSINLTGTINAKYQDVAEWVPSSEQLPAGTVVVLDTSKSNQVISSTQSYDTRVAGVISERPGLALGEGGEGKVLVATTGRVLVNVDATKSAIHIGDLLVTSDVSGVAMKSEPIKIGGRLMHMPGTLIGKALEPLEKGSGKILVLLSLQ